MFFCEKYCFLTILIILSEYDAANSAKRPDPKCLLPLEPGPCRMHLKRFYYNSKTNTCEEFIFGGCKGNDNQFSSKQTCEAFCKKPKAVKSKTSSLTASIAKIPQNPNKQLKSETLKTLTTNAGISPTTTTPKS